MKRFCSICGAPTERVEHPVANGAYGELVVDERAVCEECARKREKAKAPKESGTK